MPKLRGEAQEKLFVQYAFNAKSSSLQFMRFMFASKSNALIVFRLLSNMTLQQNRNGNDYSITVKKSDIFFSQISLSDKTLELVFKFLRPQNFGISLDSETDWNRLNELLPYLQGANKLCLHTSDPEMIPFVQTISEQLIELTCSADVLMLPGFPQMKLDKFTLLDSFPFAQENFKQIFRHEIKELDLTRIADSDLKELNFGEDIVGPQSINHLILKISGPDMKHEILTFVEKLYKLAPNLNSLDLSIMAPSFYFNIHDQLSKQILEIYDDIIKFKEQAPEFIQKLAIKFKGETFTVESEDYEVDWMDALKKNERFGNATFSIDPVNGEESVKLKYRKMMGSVAFSLDFGFTFSVLSEDEHRMAIEDNLDIDELGIDESEIDYDYNDDPSEYEEYEDFD